MVIAVLVKVVPELEEIHFDPATLTLQREGAALVLNPFDLRAVLVALSLRSPSERVVVISMGPRSSALQLKECLALGAHEAILITDRALAGSDTLVTANVLARVLSRHSPRLVLGGRYSIDSSTAQVLSQVAERLGVPMVEPARSITSISESLLEVYLDTEDGWERHRVPLPAVVGVGEKILKVRHPTEEDLARTVAEVQILDGGVLGLTPKEVGMEGSPSRVIRVARAASQRTSVRIKTGDPEVMVSHAVNAVKRLLRERGPVLNRSSRIPFSGPGPIDFAVLASNMFGGTDARAVEIPGMIQGPGGSPRCLGIFLGSLSPSDKEGLSLKGFSRVYHGTPAHVPISPERASAMVAKVAHLQPSLKAILFASSSWSRAVAGRVSARLGLGLAGDVLTVSEEPQFGLLFGKPSFGGGLIAEVQCKTVPALATVRCSPRLTSSPKSAEGRLEITDIASEHSETPSTYREGGPLNSARFGNLDTAHLVVGVGMGVGSPENIDRIAEAVQEIRGAIGASRKVVDAGWVPPQLQIGLTGRSIDPDVYIAVGIKGKATHMAGVRRARVVVGLNVNPDEPIFEDCDVGIVGRWEDLLFPLLQGIGRSGTSTTD